MDQASALPAASCERNPAAPRTSSSCSRSEDRSQTGALPPARLDPQSVPHAAPSSRDPRPSSPALCSTQRDICCRIFTPAQPEYPAASVRDNCSGAYTGWIRRMRVLVCERRSVLKHQSLLLTPRPLGRGDEILYRQRAWAAMGDEPL